MARFPALVIATLVIGGSAFSQPANPAPAFEVASVKIAGPSDQKTLKLMHGGPGTSDPTRFTYTRANLASLLMRAYGSRMDQISGPDWIKDFTDARTMYAITAVVPPNTSREQFNLMLQNLLAERFHLAVRHEVKEFPGYELVVADGGPKLTECIPEADKNGCPSLPFGGSMTTALSSRMGTWGTISQRFIMSMPEFAEALGPAINESNGMEAGAMVPRVSDKTGLSGTHDFKLNFTGLIVMPGMTPSPATGELGDGPSLSSSLEKQLGLKLVKTKNVPVDILIVDRADKVPTEN